MPYELKALIGSPGVATDGETGSVRAFLFDDQSWKVLYLRSTSHILGYHVRATDGEFGILENFVMDEASWHLGYFDVKCGDWLQNRSVLVPTGWVQSVSWANFRIHLHHMKAETGAPDGSGSV